MRGLAGALFTPVQQRVLGLLFGQPARRYQSAEIIRLADSGTGAVHRQLRRLETAGLVTVTRQGNQKFYQANRDAPIFKELHGIALKTSGLADPLRAALEPYADAIAVAFVFGSIADGSDRAESDIDVMVVSDELSYPDVYGALSEAEQILGRTINPTVLTRDEWHRRRNTPDSFVSRLAHGRKIIIGGDEDALA
jgi:predicted nucleotidyltransferase